MRKIRVKSIKKIKIEPVYAIKTTFGTFIADGVYHHNCFACNLRHEYYPEYYTKWFIENYGSLMYEDLVDRSQKLIKVNREYLEKILAKYT